MPVKGPKETAIACAISATSLRAAVCVTWRVAAIVTSVDACFAAAFCWSALSSNSIRRHEQAAQR